jgi:HrpA-like RNA helicase
LLEDLDEGDDMKFSIETNLQELKDHLKTFEQTISELSTLNPATLEEVQYLLNRSKREIERFKAHLPIYARRQQLIDTIKFSRVVILKAETGSGKSSQLIQYLADAGFADHGLSTRIISEFLC